ncbi:glycosyltransferase [Microbacterium aurantiacum]|uniref:Glycosyltransferase n=1 Tax=Microbacterium aurantiacum TaxID=162393 RepID=A0AAJ2HB29_9MICO|nr:glycosyltransferase [Microbacterium aurantiacum]MDS0244217.1 glycosyltransferase [Microbacterium aurantiacum]
MTVPQEDAVPRSVSVVLPSYRRIDRVSPLVEEYLRQGADQVIVILDGPHPGWEGSLSGILASERVTVAELPANVGLARARIEGLNRAHADIVMAVDDDVEPETGLLDAHRRFHAPLGDRVLQGYMPVALPARRGADDAPTFLYARDYEAQARVWDAGDSDLILASLWGGNVSLPRGLYQRAEELRPSVRLEYNEDLDLGIRLQMLGAQATFDRRAAARHHHDRGVDAFLAECLARGGAVSTLEHRWGRRPPQLTPLVEISPTYNRALARVQRAIAARDDRGVVEAALVALYRVAGRMHAWRVQDGVARVLRRALIMRGYRLTATAFPTNV